MAKIRKLSHAIQRNNATFEGVTIPLVYVNGEANLPRNCKIDIIPFCPSEVIDLLQSNPLQTKKKYKLVKVQTP